MNSQGREGILRKRRIDVVMTQDARYSSWALPWSEFWFTRLQILLPRKRLNAKKKYFDSDGV